MLHCVCLSVSLEEDVKITLCHSQIGYRCSHYIYVVLKKMFFCVFFICYAFIDAGKCQKVEGEAISHTNSFYTYIGKYAKSKGHQTTLIAEYNIQFGYYFYWKHSHDSLYTITVQVQLSVLLSGFSLDNELIVTLVTVCTDIS